MFFNSFFRYFLYLTGTKFILAPTLDYEWIEAITICHNCQNTYSTIDYGRECPYCHSGNTVLLQGNECLIKEIAGE